MKNSYATNELGFRKLFATFITMFDEPIKAWLDSSVIARAQRKNILETRIISILKSVDYDHHAIDDTPYGGGPGELMKIDVVAPLIRQALCFNPDVPKKNKRVILMDPAGQKFCQDDAKRLLQYDELIFVSGRYEGIDARIYHYVDEALSLGDFVLSSGDLAALSIFDATARMVKGVLGNSESAIMDSHYNGRLEHSNFTRPYDYEGLKVPSVLKNGNHAAIKKYRQLESIKKTMKLRPDLIKKDPLSDDEKKIVADHIANDFNFMWMK